jgi:hypothetical protein
MLVDTGIEFEVVRAIVEGTHLLAAHRAIEFALSLGVLDSGLALVRLRDDPGFDQIEFVMV